MDLGDGRLGVDRNALESYAAVWEGYAEAYEFDCGSDRIRLALDEQGNGSVEFGVGDPLPEPTDPDQPFPFAQFATIPAASASCRRRSRASSTPLPGRS